MSFVRKWLPMKIFFFFIQLSSNGFWRGLQRSRFVPFQDFFPPTGEKTVTNTGVAGGTAGYMAALPVCQDDAAAAAAVIRPSFLPCHWQMLHDIVNNCFHISFSLKKEKKKMWTDGNWGHGQGLDKIALNYSYLEVLRWGLGLMLDALITSGMLT